MYMWPTRALLFLVDLFKMTLCVVFRLEQTVHTGLTFYLVPFKINRLYALKTLEFRCFALSLVVRVYIIFSHVAEYNTKRNQDFFLTTYIIIVWDGFQTVRTQVKCWLFQIIKCILCTNFEENVLPDPMTSLVSFFRDPYKTFSD